MALRITLSPIQPLKPKPYHSSSRTIAGNRGKTLIKCSFEKDTTVAIALAAIMVKEVDRASSVMWKRYEAFQRSQEILFAELCRYLSMESGELKAMWRGMEGEDKRALVGDFVAADWCENFHPLSARSVVELVDDLLDEQNGGAYDPFAMLPRLKKFVGMIQRNIKRMHEQEQIYGRK